MVLIHVGIEKQLVKTPDTEVAMVDLIHVGMEKQLVETLDTEVAVVDLTLQIVVAIPDMEVAVVDLTLQIVVVLLLLLLLTPILVNVPQFFFK